MTSNNNFSTNKNTSLYEASQINYKKLLIDQFKIKNSNSDKVNYHIAVQMGSNTIAQLSRKTMAKVLTDNKEGLCVLLFTKWSKDNKGSWLYNVDNIVHILYIHHITIKQLINKAIRENTSIVKFNFLRLIKSTIFSIRDYVNIIDKDQFDKSFASDIISHAEDINLDEIINDTKNDTVAIDKADMAKSYNKFTKLELACILLQLPDSGSNWLDELIMKKNHFDLSLISHVQK